MGIMAFVTILLNGIMDKFHGKLLFTILVALETYLAIFRGGYEETFVVTGMGVVAGNTVASTHRAVAMTLGKNFSFMAGEAETADTCAIAP